MGYDAFDCGPPMRLERLLGLRAAGRSSIALRLVVVLAVGWAPLLLLSVVTGPGLVSFVSDLGVQVRLLIAVPALVCAESDCLPWLGRIVRHFVDSGIVAGPDHVRFERALSSTKRLLDSWIAEAAVRRALTVWRPTC
jgi:hypothetical protein